MSEINAAVAVLRELLPRSRIGKQGLILDPSFFNWPALPVALAGDTIVPDSPLTNKSFNLSYAGDDL